MRRALIDASAAQLLTKMAGKGIVFYGSVREVEIFEEKLILVSSHRPLIQLVLMIKKIR